MGRGRRPRFYNVATQIEPRRSSRARRSPRTGLGSSGRRATHQARTVLCIALPVGIRTARNRPVTTKCCHTASRRVRLHMPSGPLGARRWRGQPDAAWRQFVLIGRFPAVLMPTSDAPQGPILAWCAARHQNEPRPPRGLDRCDGVSGHDFASQLWKNEASCLCPRTIHLSHHSADPLC